MSLRTYYEHAGITIYHGDCREVECPSVDAVVTDPPYGMGWDGRIASGPNSNSVPNARSWSYGQIVVGDDSPFDPRPWLHFRHVILWGANHYAAMLPKGTLLVWIKRFDAAFGTFLSDAEVAWMKGGHGVYCFRDASYKRAEDRWHPTQKPQSLMRWCLKKTQGVVLDPFMGSGSTLVAAKLLGRQAIGVEIDERYCEIAANRLAQEVLPLHNELGLAPATPGQD